MNTIIRRQSICLTIAAAALAATRPARAELPHAIAVADDVSDRIMLFDPRTGDYRGDLLVDADPNADHLLAPLDCEVGPPLEQGGQQYPETILVSDQRLQAILAFDAASGAFLRTLIPSVSAHGMCYDPQGRLLVAAGDGGVRAYTTSGSYIQTTVPREPVDGPNNAWDVLVRPEVNGGAGDLIVSDPTLDVLLRFDLTGQRLGVFAKLPSFRFVEQLARRLNGNVLAADTFGNAVHEFDPDGTWLRAIPVTRPRGVVELYTRNLLVASEEGVQLFDGQTGELLATTMSGFPTTAPRFISTLRCPLPAVLGDLNGDGQLDGFDIGPFVLALTNPQEFEQQYPTVRWKCAADVNCSGSVDGFDIGPFVELLTQ